MTPSISTYLLVEPADLDRFPVLIVQPAGIGEIHTYERRDAGVMLYGTDGLAHVCIAPQQIDPLFSQRPVLVVEKSTSSPNFGPGDTLARVLSWGMDSRALSADEVTLDEALADPGAVHLNLIGVGGSADARDHALIWAMATAAAIRRIGLGLGVPVHCMANRGAAETPAYSATYQRERQS